MLNSGCHCCCGRCWFSFSFCCCCCESFPLRPPRAPPPSSTTFSGAVAFVPADERLAPAFSCCRGCSSCPTNPSCCCCCRFPSPAVRSSPSASEEAAAVVVAGGGGESRGPSGEGGSADAAARGGTETLPQLLLVMLLKPGKCPRWPHNAVALREQRPEAEAGGEEREEKDGGHKEEGGDAEAAPLCTLAPTASEEEEGVFIGVGITMSPAHRRRRRLCWWYCGPRHPTPLPTKPPLPARPPPPFLLLPSLRPTASFLAKPPLEGDAR